MSKFSIVNVLPIMKEYKGPSKVKPIWRIDINNPDEKLQLYLSWYTAKNWVIEQGKSKSPNCHGCIRRVCNGEKNRKSLYGFKWRYWTPEDDSNDNNIIWRYISPNLIGGIDGYQISSKGMIFTREGYLVFGSTTSDGYLRYKIEKKYYLLHRPVTGDSLPNWKNELYIKVLDISYYKENLNKSKLVNEECKLKFDYKRVLKKNTNMKYLYVEHLRRSSTLGTHKFLKLRSTEFFRDEKVVKDYITLKIVKLFINKEWNLRLIPKGVNNSKFKKWKRFIELKFLLRQDMEEMWTSIETCYSKFREYINKYNYTYEVEVIKIQMNRIYNWLMDIYKDLIKIKVSMVDIEIHTVDPDKLISFEELKRNPCQFKVCDKTDGSIYKFNKGNTTKENDAYSWFTQLGDYRINVCLSENNFLSYDYLIGDISYAGMKKVRSERTEQVTSILNSISVIYLYIDRTVNSIYKISEMKKNKKG